MQQLFGWLEPSTVLGLGSLIALVTACLLVAQALAITKYRSPLIALAVSMAFASLGMLATLHLNMDQSLRYTGSVLFLSLAAYLSGMACVALLYQPNGLRLRILAIVVLSFAGHLIWPDGLGARNWNMVCLFVLTLATAVIVAKARDPMAPKIRWFVLALCCFSLASIVPRLLSIFDPIATNNGNFLFRAVVYSVMPGLAYACLMAVINARLAHRLQNFVNKDALTDAHSRRYLLEMGSKLIDRRNASTISETEPVVFMIDVDRFKRINDTWGHAAGDAVLVHCVAIIRSVVRQDDAIVSRYGGEEFCVLVSQLSQPDAIALAERVRCCLADNPCEYAGQQIKITVSVGVAHLFEGSTLTEVINRADERLYLAKNTGRNRIVYQGHGMLPI